MPKGHLLHLLWIRWRSWILPSSRTTQRFSRWSCRGALEPQSIRWALCSLLLIFRKWLTSQIVQGPIEIARVFLQELFEGKVPSKHENKLRLCFKDLLKKSGDALKRNRQFIKKDQEAYQNQLEKSYHTCMEYLKPLLRWSKQLWRKVDCQQIIEWILVVFLFRADNIFYSPAPCPANQGSAPAARFHSPLSHCKRIKQLARFPQLKKQHYFSDSRVGAHQGKHSQTWLALWFRFSSYLL